MSKSKFFIGFIFLFLITYNLQLATSYADAVIAAVERPFMEGNYEKAVSEARQLIDQRARQRQEIYYLKGLSELKLNKFGDARDSFQAIISKYPKTNRVFDAYVGIGDSYFLAGDTDNAIKAYAEVKEKFPSDKNISLVVARLDDCRKKTSPAISAPASMSAPIDDVRVEPRSHISVQAGCFKSKRNADILTAKLAKSGYQSYVELPLAAGDRLYRVKVGRPESKEEAMSLAAKLNKNGYKTKICDENSCQ